jgi:hypothetical protein
MSTVSPDGQTVRKLTRRKLLAYGFSRDGGQVFGIDRNTSGNGPEWQLYSVNAGTGAEKMLAAVEVPDFAGQIYGFSLHPDGKSFLTTISKLPFDIWMIQGFPQPRARNWLERFADWLRVFGKPR